MITTRITSLIRNGMVVYKLLWARSMNTLVFLLVKWKKHTKAITPLFTRNMISVLGIVLVHWLAHALNIIGQISIIGKLI